MAIKFWATVNFFRDLPTTGYRPNIRFTDSAFEDQRYGLTTLWDADVPIFKGDQKFVQFWMIGHPDMAALAKGIDVGMKFEMLEGNHVTGTGTIEAIDENSIDDETVVARNNIIDER